MAHHVPLLGQHFGAHEESEDKRPEGSVRVVVVSDTHFMHRLLDVPDGDILLHCGDFVRRTAKRKYYDDFNDWLGELKGRFKHRIVIGGNHEYLFHHDYEQVTEPVDIARGVLTNATYLQDSGVEVMGLRIYGSPWQTSRGMAFSSASKAALRDVWGAIPEGTDILMTHMPPRGVPKDERSPRTDVAYGDFPYLDLAANRRHWGCPDLLDAVRRRVRPTVHVFGHVHEGRGWAHDAEAGVTFINAACELYDGSGVRPPVVFDIVPPASRPRERGATAGYWAAAASETGAAASAKAATAHGDTRAGSAGGAGTDASAGGGPATGAREHGGGSGSDSGGGGTGGGRGEGR